MSEIKQLEQEMDAWKGKNPMIWKKAFNKRKELLNTEKEEPIVKVEEIIKPKEKVYAKEDVNRDGKVDLEDALDVVKKVFRKKKK